MLPVIDVELESTGVMDNRFLWTEFVKGETSTCFAKVSKS